VALVGIPIHLQVQHQQQQLVEQRQQLHHVLLVLFVEIKHPVNIMELIGTFYFSKKLSHSGVVCISAVKDVKVFLNVLYVKI
jgi:hypothetical protein